MHKRMLCGCGCQGLAREDLIQSRVNGVLHWRCPKHRGFKKGMVLRVLITCPDCGVKMVTTFVGAKNKLRCTPCQDERNKRVITVENKKASDKERKYSRSKTSNSLWYKETG